MYPFIVGRIIGPQAGDPEPVLIIVIGLVLLHDFLVVHTTKSWSINSRVATLQPVIRAEIEIM